MTRALPASLATVFLALSLSACAAPQPSAQPASAVADPVAAPIADPVPDPARVCNAAGLSWTIGQLVDDALVERATREAGAQSVRMLRPGIMITQEFKATRLNIRVDGERKVITTSCG